MTDTVTKPENITASAERSDAITATASPRPWRVVAYDDSLQCDIYDANGTPVCTMVNFSEAPQSDAALIVDAVNERDALREERDRLAADEARYRTHNVVLRNIVRRLADLTTNLLANYEHRYREDRNSMDFVGNARALLREARVAIGEDTPCN